MFSQIVCDGSFASAGRTQNMAPSVVTRMVGELENHLGARLLQRTTRSLALTEIGELYLERVQRVVAELEDADALADASSRQPSGTLRVRCPPAFAVHQLARQLPRFRALFPHIRFEIAAPGPVDSADDNVDVSIVSIGQQPLQGEFVARRLASSTFIVCAATAYLDRRGRPEHPTDLLRHDGLLPAVAAVRRELTLFRRTRDHGDGGENRVTLALHQPVLSTGQIDLLLASGLAGLGIVGLPSFVASRAGVKCHVQWRHRQPDEETAGRDREHGLRAACWSNRTSNP